MAIFRIPAKTLFAGASLQAALACFPAAVSRKKFLPAHQESICQTKKSAALRAADFSGVKG